MKWELLWESWYVTIGGYFALCKDSLCRIFSSVLSTRIIADRTKTILPGDGVHSGRLWFCERADSDDEWGQANLPTKFAVHHGGGQKHQDRMEPASRLLQEHILHRKSTDYNHCRSNFTFDQSALLKLNIKDILYENCFLTTSASWTSIAVKPLFTKSP